MNISNNELKNVEIEGCKVNYNLETIDLSFNHLNSIDIFSTFKNCFGIKSLNLSNNNIRKFYISEQILDVSMYNKTRRFYVSATFEMYKIFFV